MYIRLLAIGLAAIFGAAAAHADERPFKRQDYESYFSVGSYATWSPFYQSDGTLEMTARRSWRSAGQYMLEQTTKSFDVSVNYDRLSRYKFYKIESLHTDQMTWDARRELYVYDYTAAEFREETSQVWESNDNKVELSKGDKPRGELQQFYRDADKRAGQNPRAQEDEFLKEVIGGWTWRCAYTDKKKGFDVECRATHQKSSRVENFFYRKLDLVG